MKSERTAATPGFLVPTVTLEVGVILKTFPQFGQTFISSVTAFPHFEQKGNEVPPPFVSYDFVDDITIVLKNV